MSGDRQALIAAARRCGASMRAFAPRMRLAAAAAVLLAVSAAVGACGASDRSPQALCEAFYSRAAPLHAKYTQAAGAASQNPLGSLATALSSIGDLATVFDAMDQHAPADIEPDTAQLRDEFRRLEDNIGQGAANPIGALASGLATSLASAGAYQRVADYLDAHCPLSSDLARKYVGTGTP